MKKLILAASIATLLSSTVQADTLLGLYVGGQFWDAAAAGSYGNENDADQVNMQAFDLNDEHQTSFYVALEHPIPLIPNIKVASTTLDTNGVTQLDGDFSFGGIDYPASTNVSTTFEMSYIDYTLYYEILDNDLVTIDIGVTARDFSGEVSLFDDVDIISASKENVDAILPMAYASVIVGLPLTGLNFFAEANGALLNDNSVLDYQVGVSYAILDNFAVDLDVKLGYRSVSLDLEDLDGLYADMTFDGVYLGAMVHF